MKEKVKKIGNDRNINKVSFWLLVTVAFIFILYLILWFNGDNFVAWMKSVYEDNLYAQIDARTVYGFIQNVIMCVGWFLITITGPLNAWHYAKEKNVIYKIVFVIAFLIVIYVSIHAVVTYDYARLFKYYVN